MSTVQILKKELKYHKMAEILRTTTFKQCTGSMSNGPQRCAIGVMMSAKGWNGDTGSDEDNRMLYNKYWYLVEEQLGVTIFDRIMNLNDRHRWTFPKIADWLESLD